ncbi:MAG: FAD-binding oxidoreductase [Hyphomicrobiales bacterium]
MTVTADVAIVGAGIAGVSLAYRLAPALKVVILEREDWPGYHASGRSAAMYEPTFGPPVMRAFTRASGAFFHDPPTGFAESPLVTDRGVLMVGEPGDEALLAEALTWGYEPATEAFARALVPRIRFKRAIGFLWDGATKDIDVDVLLQGYLRAAKRAGATVSCSLPLLKATRAHGAWRLETVKGLVEAPVVVNGAGAWADGIADLFGARPRGLQPKRRSAMICPAPEGEDVDRWPQVFPAREDFYCKPTGGKLMISPADADPMDPHDAYADDLRLAEGAAAFERLIDWPITRVERSWGGLRTFAPDGDPVVGYDDSAEGFFWLAGQGGYGMQTSPALSEAAACLLKRQPLPGYVLEQGVGAADIAPSRTALAR